MTATNSSPVRLTPLGCGWLTGATRLFLRGVEGSIRVPVPAYRIEHPKGTILFDAGMHPDVATDPVARLGPIAKVFAVEMGLGDRVSARLEAHGSDPDRVDLVIVSHLHFDHAGGLASIPNADLMIQRREWEAAEDPDLAQRNGYLREDFDHGHRLRLVDGEHDVFGDGSVVCIPTHGHTPGHQSLRVRLDTGDVILAGDACYLHKTLADRHLPSVVHDEAEMLASLDRLDALQQGGAQIYFGHDPELWQSLIS